MFKRNITIDKALVRVNSALGQLDEAINYHETEAQKYVDKAQALRSEADAAECSIVAHTDRAKRAARIKLRFADLLS
ncbi:MAG: hypothetical protein RBS78_00910 [Coriobacteriia bacterium]|jgi:hypothetical protein|nr:hypothetical protein [Coriobacteriia bacterium]